MDPMTILARLGSDNPPTDDEISEAIAAFKELGRDAVANREKDEAATLLQAMELLKAEQTARAAIEAETDAAVAELADAFTEEGDEDDEAEADEDDEAEAEAEAEDVSFDADAARRAAANARSRIDAAAVPENPYPHVKVRGLGQAASDNLNHTSTARDLAEVFRQYAVGDNRGRDTYARVTWEYPQERTLLKEAGENDLILDSFFAKGVTNFEAIAAAGGICGPLDTVFDIPLIGSRGRPVRDALVRFGAGRGGVRYNAAPRLSQATGVADTVRDAVGVWTAANDASPSSPATKPCPHIDCAAICEVEVSAITACLVVGNFQARFSTEQWLNALGLLGIQHDRVAEQALLADIDAGSIDATFTAASGGTIASHVWPARPFVISSGGIDALNQKPSTATN